MAKLHTLTEDDGAGTLTLSSAGKPVFKFLPSEVAALREHFLAEHDEGLGRWGARRRSMS